MKKKAALYTPFLDVLGGGEKYILSILQSLESTGFQVFLFTDTDESAEILRRLNVSFQSLSLIPNVFKHPGSFIKKALILKNFDYFIYVTNGSYFFSPAKHNIVYAMIPDRALYSNRFLTLLKLKNYRFITHSFFTQSWLKTVGINSEVLYPYISEDLFVRKNQFVNKDKIILSVGRFFRHLHSKRQDKIINLFNELQQKDRLFKQFKLILAGGLKNEDKGYYENLQKIAKGNNNIIFKPNISYRQLLELYRKSLIYWHFAGYGVDELRHPEEVEHMGITPLEAMASGCVAFCYNAGGPKEYIKNGENGFLFKDTEELTVDLKRILSNPRQLAVMREHAQSCVKQKFNRQAFDRRVKEVVLRT